MSPQESVGAGRLSCPVLVMLFVFFSVLFSLFSISPTVLVVFLVSSSASDDSPLLRFSRRKFERLCQVFLDHSHGPLLGSYLRLQKVRTRSKRKSSLSFLFLPVLFLLLLVLVSFNACSALLPLCVLVIGSVSLLLLLARSVSSSSCGDGGCSRRGLSSLLSFVAILFMCLFIQTSRREESCGSDCVWEIECLRMEGWFRVGCFSSSPCASLSMFCFVGGLLSLSSAGGRTW